MSGWRAALVALVVGAVILGIGYLVPRLGTDGTAPDAGNGGEDTSGVVLACAPAIQEACTLVAAELELSTVSWQPGASLPDRHVLIAPAADLPEGAEQGPPLLESPIVVGAWLERSQILSARCGSIDVECVVGALGSRWEELGGNDTWGDFKIGLADPTTSDAGMLAFSLLSPVADRGDLATSLRLVTTDDDRLTEDMVLFGDSRADLVITTEIAVFKQMSNAIGRGGRLEIFYPTSSPWVEYVTSAQGFGAGRVVERLSEPSSARLFASAGIRPASGSWDMPAELGTPGPKASPPDPATRATLVEAWERLR